MCLINALVSSDLINKDSMTCLGRTEHVVTREMPNYTNPRTIYDHLTSWPVFVAYLLFFCWGGTCLLRRCTREN